MDLIELGAGLPVKVKMARDNALNHNLMRSIV